MMAAAVEMMTDFHLKFDLIASFYFHQISHKLKRIRELVVVKLLFRDM
jgi:hypothetical protein